MEPSDRVANGRFGRLSRPLTWSRVGFVVGVCETLVMPMREECKHYESRSYANGEAVRKCDLDQAPEAPWRCPEPCVFYERRLVDIDWQHGSLVTPPPPPEPKGEGIAELLDEAEDIVNAVGPEILAEFERQQRKSASRLGRLKRRFRRGE